MVTPGCFDAPISISTDAHASDSPKSSDTAISKTTTVAQETDPESQGPSVPKNSSAVLSAAPKKTINVQIDRELFNFMIQMGLCILGTFSLMWITHHLKHNPETKDYIIQTVIPFVVQYHFVITGIIGACIGMSLGAWFIRDQVIMSVFDKYFMVGFHIICGLLLGLCAFIILLVMLFLGNIQ
jgi:hypothetical protein